MSNFGKVKGVLSKFVLLLFATPLLPYSPALNCPVSLVVDENAKPVGYLADGRFEADVIKKSKIAAEATRKATAKATVKAKEVKDQVQKKVDDYKNVSSSV